MCPLQFVDHLQQVLSRPNWVHLHWSSALHLQSVKCRHQTTQMARDPKATRRARENTGSPMSTILEDLYPFRHGNGQSHLLCSRREFVPQMVTAHILFKWVTSCLGVPHWLSKWCSGNCHSPEHVRRWDHLFATCYLEAFSGSRVYACLLLFKRGFHTVCAPFR